MKLIILTGQLGSGKTTVLANVMNTLPKNKSVGIIINEYSVSGIDSDFIGKKGVNELNDGCVCCNKGEDLKDLLVQMKNKDYVLLETTGLSDLNQLMERLSEFNFEIANVVLLLDGYRLQKSKLSNNTIKQIKISPTVVITKTDLIKDTSALKKQIKKIKPDTVLYESSLQNKISFKDINKDNKIKSNKKEYSFIKKLIYELLPELKMSKESRHINKQKIKSLAFNLGLIDYEKFNNLLEKETDLIRAKGFVKTNKGNFKFNYTYGLFYLEKTSKKLTGSRLVFIGKFGMRKKIGFYKKVYGLEKNINISSNRIIYKALTNR